MALPSNIGLGLRGHNYFIAVYIDSLVMISIEWSEKTQKNALDV